MDGRTRSLAQALRHSLLVDLAFFVGFATGLTAWVHTCHGADETNEEKKTRSFIVIIYGVNDIVVTVYDGKTAKLRSRISEENEPKTK